MAGIEHQVGILDGAQHPGQLVVFVGRC